jgi:branched-chain amino acid transport system permease protein
VVVGVPSLRLRGDYLAIATLGFGQIIAVVINKTEMIGTLTVGGSAGLHDIPVLTNFFWTFGWCVICVVTVWRVVHCVKGKAFWAVQEDEIAAAAVGVDPTRVKVTAFVLGAFFAGVAGGLYAMWEGNLSPGSFGFVKSIEIVVMVVLGGSGSIGGSILAAAVLTWLPEQLRFLEDWRLVIYALLLIGIMLVRPEGLLGKRSKR